MRLLPLTEFDCVFKPLVGRKAGVVDGWGNPGDRLLDAAARQLLEAFGILWQTVNPLAYPPGSYSVDCLLLFGGGSMGGPPICRKIREAAVRTGLPCIVLPQSFHAPEDCSRYRTVYVRERASLELCPNGVLAPDLALGYRFSDAGPPKLGRGVFLRKQGHSAFPGISKVDPAAFCDTVDDYIRFAGQYEHIVTDRLHLAITSLGLGRKATLLPVAYPKNRSMWETWLRGLGCGWSESP
jgi:hypothetical protein